MKMPWESALTKVRMLAYCSLLILLSACGNVEFKDRTKRKPVDPKIEHARVWADTVLGRMSLEEKVAQLVTVVLPEAGDTSDLRNFIRHADEKGYGGAILPLSDTGKLLDFGKSLSTPTKTPLWLGTSIDNTWKSDEIFPSMSDLGTIHTDTLVRDWAATLGELVHAAGFHFCLNTSAIQGEYENWNMNYPGMDVSKVSAFSLMFSAGLQSASVVPVVRILPENEKAMEVTWKNSQANGEMIKKLIESGPQIMQTSFSALENVDELPTAWSSKFIYGALKKQIGYNGLVFSAMITDSLNPNGLSSGQAALKALSAGNDVLIFGTSPDNAIQQILTNVNEGKISGDFIDKKVRAILEYKAMAGLDSAGFYGNEKEFTKAKNRLTGMNRIIAKNSLVLLRDYVRRLPCGPDIIEAKVASLAIGSLSKTKMQRSMDHYTEIDHRLLRINAPKSSLDFQLGSLAKYEYVIIEVHNGENDTLSDDIRRFIMDLDSKTRLVTVNFGKPGTLKGLDSLKCLVASFRDTPFHAELAGQYVFGGFTTTGRLPFGITGAFAAGEGIQKNTKTRFEYTEPEELGADRELLAKVDSIVNTAIWMGTFPGCQVLAAKDGKVFFDKSYGFHDYTKTQPVRHDDLYDIASITKIAATTLAAMKSYELDSLNLTLPIKTYLDELDSNFITIKDITPTELMLHKAGLPSGLPLYSYYTLVDSVDSLRSMCYKGTNDSLYCMPVAQGLYFNRCYYDTIWNKVRCVGVGKKEYKYSDMSMFLMRAVIERLWDMRLDSLVDSLFYRPMGLKHMTYLPLKKFDKEQIVPTEDDRWWRKQTLRGYVHDPTAALYGGIGGHAGLFSNAEDLAILMQMLLNGGTYGGRRYFSEATVRKFTSRQPDSHRGLGFDMQSPKPNPEKGFCCPSAAPITFGHIGFTGTATWADPENGIVYVFLSNRVYPKSQNWKINIYKVRQSVQQAIYEALGIGLVPEDAVMLTEKSDSTKIDSSGQPAG